MLRSFTLGLGLLMLAGGLWGIASHFPPGFPFTVLGTLIVIGIILERVIYKPVVKKAPGAGWEKTSERFVDGGKPVTVYIKLETGERMYVEE